jgi:hypothetical protein
MQLCSGSTCRMVCSTVSLHSVTYSRYKLNFTAHQKRMLLQQTVRLRGRLHLRFECAVWICTKRSAVISCVFGVQQNTWSIASDALDGANRGFWVCSLSAHWNLTLKTHIENARTLLHTAQCTALGCIWQMGYIFCCILKKHVIAADRLLYIETTHPKRKCNWHLSSQIVAGKCVFWSGKNSFWYWFRALKS